MYFDNVIDIMHILNIIYIYCTCLNFYFIGYDVIIIGEFHTDPVAHLIEYNFLKEAINAHLSNSNNKYSAREEDKRRGKVILSLEMLERDIQVRKVTQKMLFSICVKDRIQISTIF